MKTRQGLNRRVSRWAVVAAVAGLFAMGGCGDDSAGPENDAGQPDGAPGTDGQASDGQGPDAQGDLVVDDVQFPQATEMVAYGPVSLTASNGTQPYFWTLDSGSLPDGVTLDATGVLSGTPAPGTAVSSPYTFTVRVTDAVNDSATRPFSLTVNPGSYPINDLDNVTLHLNLGDSMGAGYNADSGMGYAPLVHHNHSAYPAYAQHNLQALFSGCQFVNRASSGDTSGDVAGGQTSNLPNSAGDTVVTIYVGGNDFNDNVQTMLLPSATQAAIDNWVNNMTTVMNRLRNAYEDTANGRYLVVLMANIHEPTDGTGTLPPQYTDGFCGTLQQVPQALVQTVMSNYNMFNAAIENFAAAQGAILIDSHALFIGHGLTVDPSEQWLDTDCAHANNEGHHQLRRLIWALLTGQWY